MRISGTPEVSLRMSLDNRNAANLTAVLVDYGAVGSADAPVMVTRGWLDPQNRHSIERSQPVRQDKLYSFEWDLQPDDYVFKAATASGSSLCRPTTTTRSGPRRARGCRCARRRARSASPWWVGTGRSGSSPAPCQGRPARR